MQQTVNGGVELVTGWAFSGYTLQQLWVQYLACGGSRCDSELLAYLATGAGWPATEHNAVAIALNERCADQHLNHVVPYAHQIS